MGFIENLCRALAKLIDLRHKRGALIPIINGYDTLHFLLICQREEDIVALPCCLSALLVTKDQVDCGGEDLQ